MTIQYLVHCIQSRWWRRLKVEASHHDRSNATRRRCRLSSFCRSFLAWAATRGASKVSLKFPAASAAFLSISSLLTLHLFVQPFGRIDRLVRRYFANKKTPHWVYHETNLILNCLQPLCFYASTEEALHDAALRVNSLKHVVHGDAFLSTQGGEISPPPLRPSLVCVKPTREVVLFLSATFFRGPHATCIAQRLEATQNSRHHALGSDLSAQLKVYRWSQVIPKNAVEETSGVTNDGHTRKAGCGGRNAVNGSFQQSRGVAKGDGLEKASVRTATEHAPVPVPPSHDGAGAVCSVGLDTSFEESRLSLNRLLATGETHYTLVRVCNFIGLLEHFVIRESNNIVSPIIALFWERCTRYIPSRVTLKRQSHFDTKS